MVKCQKRRRRKLLKLLIVTGIFILVLGFIIWAIYELIPAIFPAWFDKVWPIVGGFGALLALLSTAIAGFASIRELIQEQKTASSVGLADSKPIRRVKYETLTARLGKSGKIPWIDRGTASPGLLREHGRIAILGWMKSGKTREAAEVIRMATEDGTIAAIYEPTSALDLIEQGSLFEAVTLQADDREKMLFFVDELGLRPELERLERLSQCLETITTLRRDAYCLITVQRERLTDTVRNWLTENNFYLLELRPLNISQRQELVNTAKKIWKFDVTPDAVDTLASQTDGRPYSIVFTLQQSSQETELNKAFVEKRLNQSDEEAWAEQRRNVIASEPFAEILLESIVVFVSAGVTLRSSNIKEYAYYRASKRPISQTVKSLLQKAADRWATFDIVETEGLFTIPEPLVVPLLEEREGAKKKLKIFIAYYNSKGLNIYFLSISRVLDKIIQTKLWKKISNFFYNLNFSSDIKDRWQTFVKSHIYERTIGWLVNQIYHWPADRALLLMELGEQVVKSNYLFSKALVSKGWRSVQNDNYQEAIDYFTKAISLNPKNAVAYAHQGQAYRGIDKLDKAILVHDRAVLLDSDNSFVIAQRGVTYRKMECYKEALQDLSKAIKLDEKYTWAIAQRGITYRQMNSHEEALRDLNRTIELDEDYAWAIAQRGITYRKTGRYQEALQDFNRAIELHEKNAWIAHHKAYTYLLLGQCEEAVKDFEYAIQSEPESDWDLYLNALAHFKLNKEEALTNLERAIFLATQKYNENTDNYARAFNLALYCLVNQDAEKTMQIYQETLKACTSAYDIGEAIIDLKDLLEILPECQGTFALLNLLESRLSELQSTAV